MSSAGYFASLILDSSWSVCDEGKLFSAMLQKPVEHALSLQNSPAKKKYPLRNRLKITTDHEVRVIIVLLYYSLTWPYKQLVL